MKITIEATKPELDALELDLVELGAERAEVSAAARSEEAGEPGQAAVWRARASASLSPSTSAAIKALEEWMTSRRGWSSARVEVLEPSGAAREVLRACFEQFGGAGRLHAATAEVWLDVAGGTLCALLPPCHEAVPELRAELEELVARSRVANARII